jgi:hypothetical protein
MVADATFPDPTGPGYVLADQHGHIREDLNDTAPEQ